MKPRVPTRVLSLLSIALVAVLAVLVVRDLVRPPSEEEKLRALVDDLVEAQLDRDFEKIRDLACPAARDRIREEFSDLRRPGGVPDRKAFWFLTGLVPAEYRDLDTRGFFLGASKGFTERHPGETAEWDGRFRALAAKDVGIRGDRARVSCVAPDDWTILFDFRREAGRWGLLDVMAVRMRFKTLERKVAAFLPRGAVAPSSVGLVVEVGPGSLDRATRDLLPERFRLFLEKRPERPVAVLDAAGDVAWEDLIRILDGLRRAGFREICFTRSGEREPRPGIRLNGVPLAQAGPDAPYEDPGADPALRRILSVGAR